MIEHLNKILDSISLLENSDSYIYEERDLVFIKNSIEDIKLIN